MATEEQLAEWKARATVYDKEYTEFRAELLELATQMFPEKILTSGMWKVVAEEAELRDWNSDE